MLAKSERLNSLQKHWYKVGNDLISLREELVHELGEQAVMGETPDKELVRFAISLDEVRTKLDAPSYGLHTLIKDETKKEILGKEDTN